MNRRSFLQNTSGVLAVAPVVSLVGFKADEKPALSEEQALAEKVKKAMLAMQRASWEQGVAMQAIYESGDLELTRLMALESALRQLPDGRLSVVYSDNGVTDPGASGEAVLAMAKKYNDATLAAAAEKMLAYFQNKAPKSENGIVYHTLSNPEFWIDSMYMLPPFLAVSGNYAEAVKQINGVSAALWNKEFKLFSHRWDDRKKVFANPAFWGVGNGWAVSGMTRVINALPATFAQEKKMLISRVVETLDSCLKYIRPDGLFHNNINDPATFVETNLSQMLAYSIYEGVRNNWLDRKYLEAANKMRKAAHSKVDELGFVQGVCGAPHFDAPGRATEGQAFFILMESAWKKL